MAKVVGLASSHQCERREGGGGLASSYPSLWKRGRVKGSEGGEAGEGLGRLGGVWGSEGGFGDAG